MPDGFYIFGDIKVLVMSFGPCPLFTSNMFWSYKWTAWSHVHFQHAPKWLPCAWLPLGRTNVIGEFCLATYLVQFKGPFSESWLHNIAYKNWLAKCEMIKQGRMFAWISLTFPAAILGHKPWKSHRRLTAAASTHQHIVAQTRPEAN